MPYKVEKRGSEWVTVTEGTGKVHGHFKSRAQAVKQLRALYAEAPPEAENKDKGCTCDCAACMDGAHEVCLKDVGCTYAGDDDEPDEDPADEDEDAPSHDDPAREHSTSVAKVKHGDTLERVRRFDVARAVGARRLDNGWLRAEGTIARTGVQEYRRGDGTVIRELRLPEEVFRPETMQGLQMAPVTDEHPPAMLDATNTQQYARGHLGENIEQVDGKFVKASLLVTDATLVDKVLSGKQAELSVGYFCDLEHEPGTWQGQHYDCIQRNITPNHVAVTARARGGPELRVRLDSADAISIGRDRPADDEPAEEHNVEPKVKKIKVDSVEFEIPAEVERMIERERQDAAAKLAGQAGESKAKLEQAAKDREAEKVRADSEKARADAAEAKAAAAEQKLAQAVKEAAAGADARVRARIELEAKSTEVLGSDFKFDGMADMAIRRAIVAKLSPALKLDGRDDGFVLAAYEFALANAEAAQGEAGLAATRAATVVTPKRGVETVDSGATDYQSVRAKRIKESESAWKDLKIGARKE